MPKTLLRRERERRGWSRGYIAEQVEVDVITVGRWERGERLPHPHYRQQLCTLFAMTAEELGLLPEMFQKSDEAVNTTQNDEQAAEVVEAALELSPVTSAGEATQQPASSSPAGAEETLSRQRRKLLLGIGGLGIASLTGISAAFYIRSLGSASAHISPPAALVLPTQPIAQLFDPTNYTNWVNRLAWSPDGSQVAVANGEPRVSIWKLAQQEVQLYYPTLDGWVNDVSWSKTGWIAAANAGDTPKTLPGQGSVQVWKFPEAAPAWTLPFPYALRSVSWSPDGTLLALAGHAQTVGVWKPFTVQPLSLYRYPELQPQQGINRVRWSPDGTMLACATDDGTVHVLQALTGKVLNIYREHKIRTVDLDWSPDGTYIASGSEDRTVRVWQALSGQTLLVYLGHTDNVEAIDWSPQSTYIASGSADSTVLIWEAHTGKLKTKYRIPTQTVETLLWSRDGRKIAAGTNHQGTSIW